MKKFTLVICALMLAQLIACGETGDNVDVVTTAVTSEEEQTVDDDYVPDDLPDIDLNGYQFRILGFGDERFAAIWVEDQNGSIVNDAVYDKCKAVEDRFNCSIVLAEGSTVGSTADTASEKTIIQTTVMSGEDSFDIASGHDITIANMTLEGLFLNILDVPHLNFEKPWWPKYTVDSLTFDGQMYMFSNSLSYNNMADTRVMYFNKTLFTDLGLDMPYSYVYDGTWTLDKLNSLTKLGYEDLNGNSMVDEEDQFGIVNASYYYCVLEPFNLEPYQDDGESTLTYVFDLDKYSTLTNKFYELFFGDGGFIAADGDAAKKIFGEGRAMFTYESLNSAVKNFSLTDLIYGILPMPKYDESQTEYYAGCTDRPCVVPITASGHLDETGLIIEALSAEGYRKVFPAYFEQALKVRYADQTEDADMIDIINQNVILSFTYMYGNFVSPYNKMFETLFNASTPSTDVASYAASIEATQQKRVAEIMEVYADLKER